MRHSIIYPVVLSVVVSLSMFSTAYADTAPQIKYLVPASGSLDFHAQPNIKSKKLFVFEKKNPGFSIRHIDRGTTITPASIQDSLKCDADRPALQILEQKRGWVKIQLPDWGVAWAKTNYNEHLRKNPLLINCVAAIAIPEQRSRFPAIAYEFWHMLPSARNHRCPDPFLGDGLRSIGCSVISLFSEEELRRYWKGDMYFSSPHAANGFSFKSHNKFTHYNPKFVRWLRENFIVATDDHIFRRLTEPAYRKSLAKSTHTLYFAHLFLQKHPYYARTIYKDYKQSMLDNKSYRLDGRLKKFLTIATGYSTEFPKSANINRYKISDSILFWMRRKMDGSEQEWLDLLKALIQAYDQPLLDKISEKPGLTAQSKLKK